MNPLFSFTIGASANTNLMYKVIVWRSYLALQAARNRARKKHEPRKLCDGFCHRFHKRHCDDLTIGEIHLCKTRLSIDTISHEATHAAIGLAEWVRPADGTMPLDSRDLVSRHAAIDEALAWSVGYLTEGIVFELRRHKLKIKPL